MPGLPTGPVFISYSRKDQDVMRRIVRYLGERGIKVWVDHEKLIPGTPIWEEEIEKAIRTASAAIVVMSPDSKDSEWVRREISLADQNHKQIFPLLVRGDEDSSITLRLITRQFIDMRINESAGLESLRTALSSFLVSLEVQAPADISLERAGAAQQAANVLPPREVEKQTAGSETLWIPLAWAVAGAIGGFLYSDYNAVVGGAAGGALGGLITAVTLRAANASAAQKNILWIVLAWAGAGAVGWSIGEGLTEAIGMGIGYAVLAAIAVTVTMRLGQVSFDWQAMAWIVVAWVIGGAVGWSIGRYIQNGDLLDWATGWAVGYAPAWALAGFVTIWQLRKIAK
jgi:hypothetical protein